MGKSRSPASLGAARLQLLIDRVRNLKTVIKDLQADVKDVFQEAKSVGFDPGAMKTVIKLLDMTPEDRRDSLGLVEVYMQALGMSEGGLSDLAAEFLAARSGQNAEPEPDVDQDVPELNAPAVPNNSGDQGAAEVPPEAPPLTPEDAARMGTQAHAAGKPVTANPFPPRDPRRAAWDTAWCVASGSDGMDIPEHLMSKSALEAKRKKAAEAAAGDAEAEAKAAERAAQLDGEPLVIARRLVTKHQNGSTAWLQRTMQVSYSDAAALLALLERDGVVSAPDLKGVREVLAEFDGDEE